MGVGGVGIEIERKFRVMGDGWRSAAVRSVRMAQGYINDMAALRAGTQQASVRVRIAGGQGYLNLKSRELGASRQEFDYPIPMSDAEGLLSLCVGGRIDKVRHYIPQGDLTWEVDEFAGDNAGLVVAELELPAVDTPYDRPDWLGVEVTHEPRFYNLALAERPYLRWSAAEQS